MPTIRQMRDDEVTIVQEFTVRAFIPVFESFANILGAQIFARLYPDWRKVQADLVVTFQNDETMTNWVADVEGRLAALMTTKLNEETETGEVVFLLVDPEYQNRGIGTQLNFFALDLFREGGMKLAAVSTGGDISHAPARHAYEKVGYIGIPSVYYVQSLVADEA